MNSKGISPVIATIIIGIAVIAGVVVYMFTSGTLNTMNAAVKIYPSIYSPHNSIGILNEEASFNITIRNPSKQNLILDMQITTNGNLVWNDTFVVLPESTNSTVVTQKLSYTGLWLVSVTSKDAKIGDTYSFMTLTNSVDANMQINALNEAMSNQGSSNWSNTIQVLGIVLSTIMSSIALVLSVRNSRKKVKSDG